MRYKKLTKEQIIISLDRLTRFKNTKQKYLRVYSDILTACLIEPKLKKREINNLDFEEITDYVSTIINSSIGTYSADLSINKILADYENSVFINDYETQKLLNNNINYQEAIKLIPANAPINLKWLKNITNGNSKIEREKKQLKYPIEEIILVEGITEEILLPIFAKFLGYDFDSEGIQVIPAGGKNQVVKMYYELAEQIKLPIFILLDRDAEENIRQIEPKLRKKDRIHLVSCGEFEDLLPQSLIIKTVNAHFKNFLSITNTDLEQGLSTVKTLEEIFKRKGLHEFKKSEFAKLVSCNITAQTDISEEIVAIIKEIGLGENKSLDTKFCS